MPQPLLPLIPDGATQINHTVSVIREDGEWTYFFGVWPVFKHPETDQRSFRMFTAQLVPTFFGFWGSNLHIAAEKGWMGMNLIF